VSNEAWETLSNQAVGFCGILYFLALVAHLWQWASLRKVPVAAAARETVGAGVGRFPRRTADAWTEAEVADAAGEETRRRVAMGERLGILLTVAAAAAHFVALLGRGLAAEPARVPWGNMYEFTLSGSFFVTLTYLVLLKKFRLGWLGPIVTGFVVTVLMVDVIWLYQPVAPLTEALNSYWLVIHVVSAVIATAAFTLGGFTSMLFLLKERAERKAKAAVPAGDVDPVDGPEAEAPVVRGYLARVPDLVGLDRLTYRLHAFAFPVWTFAVLITGPIWAHEAWSRYWNWDPKEVWAFITWVVYAAYLHARATAGFKGRNAAILALIGLATLWFNFIGINFFSTSSMHSYA
jgi:cytochrome c-type biogenesis protein CcsB